MAPVGMIKTIYTYYDTFRRLKPDIVQTQSGFCNQWARLAAIAARVPVVIVTVNYDEPEPKWYLLEIFKHANLRLDESARHYRRRVGARGAGLLLGGHARGSLIACLERVGR